MLPLQMLNQLLIMCCTYCMMLVQGLDMLPSIKNAVGNLFPVLMDGGIRRGTDILKVGPALSPAHA